MFQVSEKIEQLIYIQVTFALHSCINQLSSIVYIKSAKKDFGVSSSKRMKCVKAIILKNLEGDLHIQDAERASPISSTVRIANAVAKFQHCSIITKESEHLHGCKCPYYKQQDESRFQQTHL